jgi:hypothetical protein
MAGSVQVRLRGNIFRVAAFYWHWKQGASGPHGSGGMQMEFAMSIEIMAFVTIVAVLFAAGFACGPMIARKFHLIRHDHPRGHNGFAH